MNADRKYGYQISFIYEHLSFVLLHLQIIFICQQGRIGGCVELWKLRSTCRLHWQGGMAKSTRQIQVIKTDSSESLVISHCLCHRLEVLETEDTKYTIRRYLLVGVSLMIQADIKNLTEQCTLKCV